MGMDTVRLGIGGLSVETLTAMTPAPNDPGGIANAMYGSFLMVLVATFIGTPIGIMAGIYLAEYDPRVGTRILRGKDISAADYIELLARRQQWIARVQAQMADHDLMLMPTVPVIAPKIAELEASDEAYFAANGLMLRNPTLINFLDGCAVSLPCHRAGEAPVGLSLAGTAGQDQRLLSVALAVEALLAQA